MISPNEAATDLLVLKVGDENNLNWSDDDDVISNGSRTHG